MVLSHTVKMLPGERRPDCWTMKVKVCTAADRRSQVSPLAPSGQWISPGLCPDELFQKTKEFCTGINAL